MMVAAVGIGEVFVVVIMVVAMVNAVVARLIVVVGFGTEVNPI